MLLDLFRSIRISNVLLVALAQTLLLWRTASFSSTHIALILLTALWIAWGNMDNNVQDFYLDIDHKKKPINQWTKWVLDRRKGLLIERIVLLISITISALIGFKPVLLTLFAWSSLKSYNLYFKKKIVIGNILIALLCAAALQIFDIALDTNLILISGLIFTATLLRELVKDKEDEYPDKACGYKTLAIVSPQRYFCAILISLSLAMTYLAFLFFYSIPLFFIVFCIFQILQWYYLYHKNWQRVSLTIKMQIALGVLGIGFT